jgi:hypothetical protein
MKYVLKRDDGKFVARPGSEHSYTDKLQRARTFDTRDEAERDRCSNEILLTLEQAMNE